LRFAEGREQEAEEAMAEVIVDNAAVRIKKWSPDERSSAHPRRYELSEWLALALPPEAAGI
jgi:hypothetical protein